MLPGLLGKKIGMSQIFTDKGYVVPVTVLETGPCQVLQVKTVKTDGYNAVQVGFGNGKKKQTTKPLLGHLQKAKATPKRFIQEFRFPPGENGEKEVSNCKLGDAVKVDIFENTWKVNLRALTKGRGFAGMIKRWNKKSGPKTHGSRNVRRPGAIGADPRLTHIRPGKHMPGHYGVDWITVKNLEVVRIDKERNLLFIKGAAPGPNGGYVIINKTNLVKPAVVKVKEKSRVHSRGKKK